MSLPETVPTCIQMHSADESLCLHQSHAHSHVGLFVHVLGHKMTANPLFLPRTSPQAQRMEYFLQVSRVTCQTANTSQIKYPLEYFD